ncbi:hypothetical protein BUALT_Bualt11G0035400 [Buddleja alternifolia]|uniref:Uncharacterized protein n=1 Tax=Buddleja alternifolia TaxID=168488 RepID=A0AAV6WYK2_9LAMI|nr:hypothetical protein BUALT_Bualt11G0035400 [Buddleja alternifolia]
MIMSLNMESLFNQGRNHGIMDDEQLIMIQDFQNISNSSGSSTINDDDDDEEYDNSSASSSPISPSSSSPLQEMSSLLQHLPFKRGLSKHYNGKSQSFTSLSNVNCLEELAKPENPYNKKLKTCKSNGGLIPRNNTCSRLIAKKTSNRGASNCYSSLAGGGEWGGLYVEVVKMIWMPPSLRRVLEAPISSQFSDDIFSLEPSFSATTAMKTACSPSLLTTCCGDDGLCGLFL